jgi:hypothetical protein
LGREGGAAVAVARVVTELLGDQASATEAEVEITRRRAGGGRGQRAQRGDEGGGDDVPKADGSR